MGISIQILDVYAGRSKTERAQHLISRITGFAGTGTHFTGNRINQELGGLASEIDRPQ
jgi:hypothetical protein